MIIESITLKNWRGYRELHSFSFDKGFNLVVGRNEAGKSTLFEAFTRVMFDRYSSKAEEIRKIQPLNSTLGPESELIFTDSGKRYKIKKRFLHLPLCEFYTERKGHWDLDHEGDKADIELQKILKGNSSSRAAQPEHRGLAQALWYLQKEDPLPKKVWADGIKQDLAGIIDFIVKRPDEDSICSAIEDLYNMYYTSQSGKIKSNSEIANLIDEIDRKETALEDLRTKASNVEAFRLDLEEFYETKTEKRTSLLKARDDLGQLSKQLVVAEKVEKQKNDAENEINKVTEKIKILEADLKTIDRRIKSINELNKELSDAKEISENSEADLGIELNAEEKYHKTWKKELEPKLKEIEAELNTYHIVENLSRLSHEKEIVKEQVSKITRANEDYKTKKKDLEELNAPSKQDWETFEDNWTHLQILEAEARASAIRIKFDLRIKDSEITVSPNATPTEDLHEYLVLSPTTFNINKVGKIHIRGGGSTLEEINEKSQLLRDLIQKTFSRFEVSDKQTLSDLYQSRIDLEKDTKQLKKILEKVVGESKSKNLDEELERLEREIAEETQLIQEASDDWKDISSNDLRVKISLLEKTKKQLIEDIDKEQSNEKASREKYQVISQKAIDARNKIERCNSGIKSLTNENIELLKNYGTFDNLASLVDQNKNNLLILKEALDKILVNYEKCVEIPRRLHKEGETKIVGLENQIKKVENDIIDRNARIEESAAQGLYSQISDLEVMLETKKRRLSSIQLEADAIKLLHNMIFALRKEQSSMLAGPINELVDRYLKMLTDDAYDSLELNEELLPVAIQSTRYGTQLPLDSLSYGTYEQIVVLLRLALGVTLSKNERNLVVIDDRLVNADPMRMKRLCLILQEVSNNSCQIIVATCNDTPYTGIKGRIISVPSDGKLA